MSKREIDAVAAVLSDPDNSQRTAEEVAERTIGALDEARARSHRIAVVGQIQFEAQGPTYTVALGPFSARGILDSPEKFSRAVGGGTAAREAGQGLAWDSKTGRGRGRFMLVPILRSARDAWNFYRDQGAGEAEVVDLAEAVTEHLIREIEPVCICGLKGDLVCRFCHDDIKRHCHRHEPDIQPHSCRKAA